MSSVTLTVAIMLDSWRGRACGSFTHLCISRALPLQHNTVLLGSSCCLSGNNLTASPVNLCHQQVIRVVNLPGVAWWPWLLQISFAVSKVCHWRHGAATICILDTDVFRDERLSLLPVTFSA